MKIKDYFEPEVNVFIAECQKVLKEKGKKVAWYQMYEDEKIRIVQGMNSLDAFRIEILPKGHPQNLHNPDSRLFPGVLIFRNILGAFRVDERLGRFVFPFYRQRSVYWN